MTLPVQLLPARSDRVLFATFLLLGLAIRFFYVVALPLGQTVRYRIEGHNDEPSHYNYVKYLAEHREFPVQEASVRDPDAFERNEFEYYQPPAYYIACAVLHELLGSPRSLYASRLVSFAMGLLSLGVVWKIFRRLGCPPLVGAGAVLFTALSPCHAYYCSLVSNDALTWVICLLLTLEMIDVERVARPGSRLWGPSLRILALLALGMLVKTSVLLFYPPIAAFYAYGWWRTREPRFLRHGALVALGSLALVAPWYLRNLHLYGSLTATDVGNGPHQRFLFERDQLVTTLKDASRYFWFPMQHLRRTQGRRIVWAIGAGILLLNLLLAIRHYRGKGFAPAERLLLLLFAGNIVGFLIFNLYWLNAEGRFFLPSLGLILVFLTVPLHWFLAAWRRSRWFLAVIAVEGLWPYVMLLLEQRKNS